MTVIDINSNEEKQSAGIQYPPGNEKQSALDQDATKKEFDFAAVNSDASEAEELAMDSPAFNTIITQTPEMLHIIQRAQRLSRCDVPVLINGQSGTGKSLFAKAIHQASKRKEKPFVAIKCGAILPSYIEVDFFGCAKNVIPGISKNKMGFVEQANGGTLFLGEVYAIPAFIQVQILNIIQKGEYLRVGEVKPRKVNIRIIAASSKNLSEEVRLGKFRTDLFYAMSIGVLNLPPLCERRGDLFFLANYFLREINQQASSQANYVPKKLSAKARTLILSYSWPGNVSELYATLLRATLWIDNERISYDDLKEALLPGVY